MVNLVDPVETIVSILKNASTGLGTTGYEVLDDNNVAASILISLKLGEEELKALFGGSQDYDVIITVEKGGEVKDEWIGLNVKQLTVNVMLTIHAIDKWSSTGSGKKYITAPLMRSRVENALRKFIIDHTQTPGGTISIWKAMTWKEEEDKSLRPVLHKAIITTEAWTYY